MFWIHTAQKRVDMLRLHVQNTFWWRKKKKKIPTTISRRRSKETIHFFCFFAPSCLHVTFDMFFFLFFQINNVASAKKKKRFEWLQDKSFFVLSEWWNSFIFLFVKIIDHDPSSNVTISFIANSPFRWCFFFFSFLCFFLCYFHSYKRSRRIF